MVYVWLMTLGKIKCESFQTAFVKNSQPPQGAHSILIAAAKANEGDIPLFGAQIDLKKSVRHVDRNQALKAMKEHGVDKQHLASISTLWERQFTNKATGHFESKISKTTGSSHEERGKAP